MAEKKVGDTTLVHQSKTNMNHPVEERGITVLTSKELDYFRSLILERRQEAVEDIDHMKMQLADSREQAANDLAYSFHMADQGTDAMEREKAFLFASKEGRFLYHIDEALRRLYRNPKEFGSCEECGEDIGYERLDALPHTRLCIRCKELEESGVPR